MTLRDESLALRARYDEEPSHSDHVTALARQLFDALEPWHGLGAHERELLESAALLHDIGWSQTPDGTAHHKHSARLIEAQAWKSLSSSEVKIISQTARYHRKSVPQPHHSRFHDLPAKAQRLVMILGGILRLADALDRTHTQRITRIAATTGKNELVIRVQASGPWDAERTMFETKRDMLELAAGKSVRVEAQA